MSDIGFAVRGSAVRRLAEGDVVAQRWRGWLAPVAVLLAVADLVLIFVGARAGFPLAKQVVWLPAVIGPALAVLAFRTAATLTDGALPAFWRRLSYGMGAVAVAAVSQTIDISVTDYSGMP